jgi:hypothetical protein
VGGRRNRAEREHAGFDPLVATRAQRHESSFLECALVEAVAVSAGATTTPSGLLVAAS